MNGLLRQIGVLSDTATIVMILEGDVPFFEVLIRRSNPVLYRVARGYELNHQKSEDVMPETHMAAYLTFRNFEQRSSYKTWLTKILIHKCQYKLRYEAIANECPGSERIKEDDPLLFASGRNEDTEKVALARELIKVLKRSLERLPLS